MQAYAHSLPDEPEDKWELLEVHLRAVAGRCADFAAAFGSEEWGYVAGLWHDLGKYHPEFLSYLRGQRSSHPHSGAGAVHAKKKGALALAFIIAGHHAGLANFTKSGDGPKPLSERLDEAKKVEYPGAIAMAVKDILEHKPPLALPGFLVGNLSNEDRNRRSEFWARILFSALVDADRLCTELFYDHQKSASRAASNFDSVLLCEKMEQYLAGKVASLTQEQSDSTVNRARKEISDACLSAADLPPGIFSMTVPTGGGKTLAGMRFALHHANRHRHRRVIVVIPFTSIIEQNADVYGSVFGHESVLEHHSNLDPKRSREVKGEKVTQRHELAAENWDAPIIVTTTVQFFESLFSNETSRCRKIHNIVRSVIILDEVQSLPPEFLYPILDSLTELTERYGCTVVLSTATPPALRHREGRNWGLKGVHEIVANPSALAEQLRRVDYQWPDPDGIPVEWPLLAAEIAEHPQVLAVTHRRQDARELAEAVAAAADDGEQIRHLSALMCPAHRREVLAAVREDLQAGRTCRLISTQLIEAGVDVDFPIVYRAMGGLDSVVQAGGRCNREGKRDRGQVIVFNAPSNPPPGVPRKGLSAALTLLRADPELQADDPQVQEEYFRELYFSAVCDRDGIQTDRAEMNFASVGRKFHLIEDGFTRPIIIPWKDGAKRLADLRAVIASGNIPGRDYYRALQPYTVSVYEKSFFAALNAGALDKVWGEGDSEMYALKPSHMRHYSVEYGLVIGDDITLAEAEFYIV